MTLKQLSKTLSEKLNQVSQDLQDLLTNIPNVPHDSVPNGKTAKDNEVVKEEGHIPILHSRMVNAMDCGLYCPCHSLLIHLLHSILEETSFTSSLNRFNVANSPEYTTIPSLITLTCVFLDILPSST